MCLFLLSFGDKYLCRYEVGYYEKEPQRAVWRFSSRFKMAVVLPHRMMSFGGFHLSLVLKVDIMHKLHC